MKTLKKALSVILGLAIMLSCVMGMQVSVAAEGTLTVEVGKATVGDGVVTVPVIATGSLQAFTVTVDYDNNVLALADAEKVALPGVEDQAVFGPTDAEIFKMMWAFALVEADVVLNNTKIATLTFNVLDDSVADSTYIDIEVTEAWDVNGDDVATTATAIDGTVKFCEYVDANQDGRCDNCGEENLDETLTFYNKVMLLGADIRGIFQVRKQKKTNPSPYVSFKVIAEKEGVESELELVATSDKTNYTTYGYAITVAAKEMADIISARIVGITAEGEAFISNVETWSIKAGLVAIMDGAATAAVGGNEAAVNTMNLAANMLNYGAEAQKYFHYKEESLATDGLPEEYAAYIITEKPAMETIPTTDDPNAVVPFKDVTFNLGARVELFVRFTVPKSDVKEDYSAEVTQVHTAPDGTETSNNYTIEGANCIKSSKTFAVYLKEFKSNDLRDVLKVTLYKNGEVVSAEQTVSAESALNGLYDTYPSMVTALMNYGDCARAYFG